MRVAVIGLGGVGGYLAASFAKAGVDVVGFARGEHLNAIQESGLSVIEDAGEWSVPLQAKSLENAQGIFDVVLFCVKSYDLEASFKAIESHIDAKSVLLSFSNGVDNGERLKKLSNSKVLDGAVYILSHIEKAGVIRKKGKVFAAVFGGDAEATQRLATLFEKAELRYKHRAI